MQTRPITVAETQAFVRSAGTIWSDEERAALIDYVARNPETGDLIPGTGGVRKLRWGRSGSGKRGGANGNGRTQKRAARYGIGNGFLCHSTYQPLSQAF